MYKISYRISYRPIKLPVIFQGIKGYAPRLWHVFYEHRWMLFSEFYNIQKHDEMIIGLFLEK